MSEVIFGSGSRSSYLATKDRQDTRIMPTRSEIEREIRESDNQELMKVQPNDDRYTL